MVSLLIIRKRIDLYIQYRCVLVDPYILRGKNVFGSSDNSKKFKQKLLRGLN